MNAQEAYNLLKDIPEEDFITERFTDGKKKCCSLGHLSRLKSKDSNDYSYKNVVMGLVEIGGFTLRTREFLRNKHTLDENLSFINDKDNINGYTESTPKQRVLHLLKDIMEYEQSTNNT